MQAGQKLIQYFKASRQEMKKVTWPNQKEVKQHTLLVIGISTAIALFLGGADYVLTKILEVII